jgi:hypothetical protein
VDIAEREADLERREAALGAREAAVAAREAALAERMDAAQLILDAADERDASADGRDVAADGRGRALDRAQFLDPTNELGYGDDWSSRRDSSLDRGHAKDDRKASLGDRIALTKDAAEHGTNEA